jgi:hypothetical protein
VAGVKCLRLPPRNPNLNAFAERWVRSVKEECLSHLILFGERSLRKALIQFQEHYHLLQLRRMNILTKRDLLREEVRGLREEMRLLREEARETLQALRPELQALRQELTARLERMEGKLDGQAEGIRPAWDAVWRRERAERARCGSGS